MRKTLTTSVRLSLVENFQASLSWVLVAPFDGTIISHIISQARTSIDLTKITLPTFILERRSFLEMLADFLAHPDEFVKYALTNEQDT